MVYDPLKKYWMVIFIIACSCIVMNLLSLDLNHLLWDLNVYTRAVSDYVQDNDPYRYNVSFLFIYHPYVLKTFVFLNYFFSIKLWLVCLYFVSGAFFIREFLIFSRLQKEAVVKDQNLSIVLLLLAALCFGGTGLLALKTGNITIFLHFLLLAAFFYSYREKFGEIPFTYTFLIIVASVIKPYFLAYVLLMPYLMHQISVLYIISLTCFVSFLVWLSATIIMPYLYVSFMGALHYQTIAKGDLGYSIFGLIQNKTGIAYGIFFHSVIMLSYLSLLHLYARKSGLDWRSNHFIPLIIIFIIFINPRMMVYDFPVAILFGYFYLWIFGGSLLRAVRVIVLSMLVSSVPIICNVFVKLGGIEPIGILMSSALFQFFGLLILLVAIFFAVLGQVNSYRPPNKQTP